MQTTNLHEAKARLSRLIDAAAADEEIIIARAGKPIARLVALATVSRPRELGTLAGKLGPIPDDFDAALPDDVLDAFEGA